VIIYHGTYSWDGRKTTSSFPVAWFPGSYDLKIINLEDEAGDVLLMKPYVCLYKTTGEGYTVAIRPDKFAEVISSEFGIDIEKTIWADLSNGDLANSEIITFSNKCRMGDRNYYLVKKRNPLDGELTLLKKYNDSF